MEFVLSDLIRRLPVVRFSFCAFTFSITKSHQTLNDQLSWWVFMRGERLFLTMFVLAKPIFQLCVGRTVGQ